MDTDFMDQQILWENIGTNICQQVSPVNDYFKLAELLKEIRMVHSFHFKQASRFNTNLTTRTVLSLRCHSHRLHTDTVDILYLKYYFFTHFLRPSHPFTSIYGEGSCDVRNNCYVVESSQM